MTLELLSGEGKEGFGDKAARRLVASVVGVLEDDADDLGRERGEEHTDGGV